MAPSASRRKVAKDLIQAYLRAVDDAEGTHAYASLLGIKDFDAASLQARIQEGFSFTSLSYLSEAMGVSPQATGELLLISSRSLQRRKTEGRLHADESDRLLRLSRVFGRAIQLFEGDQGAAVNWMKEPLPALGHVSPLEMSKTGPGTLEVERLIGRLEHGVFS
jgi:putative toxin-antitoxin system antitoxin component (TIGR02293 family)